MDDHLIHSVLVSIQAQIAEMRERFANVDRRFERADRELHVVEARLSSEISALRAQIVEHELRHHPI